MIKLGDEVKDKVTGLKGIVVSECLHLTGCKRFEVQPKVKKDGSYADGYWMDEIQLKVIHAGKFFGKAKRKVGGPHAAPKFNNPPSLANRA